MNNAIIWVDDEPLWAESYLKGLRKAGFVVHAYDNVSEADRVYDGNVNVNGVVLDIMMPGGDLFTEEATLAGIRTGILLLRRWRDRLIARKQPVYILTNRDVAEVNGMIGALAFPKDFVAVIHKFATSPVDLPGRMTTLLQVNNVFRA